MTWADLTLWIAFLAGLASFFSPCVLALIPAYLAYLSGRAVGGSLTGKERRDVFSHGLVFVVGFSLIFILFTIIAAALGLLLSDLKIWIARLGGLVVILLGLHAMGLLRIPFLEYEGRFHGYRQARLGYLSSFLMGIFFAAGWSPCIGPILGMIITFSASGGSLGKGVLLGMFYSAGMAVPFLAAALGVGWVTVLLRRYSRLTRVVEISMGVLMVIMGILLLAGWFNILAGYLPIVDFGL